MNRHQRRAEQAMARKGIMENVTPINGRRPAIIRPGQPQEKQQLPVHLMATAPIHDCAAFDIPHGPDVVGIIGFRANRLLTTGQVVSLPEAVGALMFPRAVAADLHNKLGEVLGDEPAKQAGRDAAELARCRAFIESIAKGDTTAVCYAQEFLAPKIEPEPTPEAPVA